MQNEKQNKLVSAIATIVLGVLFITLKGEVVSIAMTVFGASMIISAIIDLTRKQVPSCVIKAVMGILIIVFGWTLVSLALYIMAAMLLIYGIIQVYELVRSDSKGKNGLNTLLLYAQPVFSIISAICLLFNQGGAIAWVFIVSGIFLIIDGALALLEYIGIKK